MDFWVFLAAAGAGYIAKHWQSRLRDEENLSELSSLDSTFVKPESLLKQHLPNKSCPLGSSAQRKKPGQDVPQERRELVAESACTGEVVSPCGFDGKNVMNIDCNVLSMSNLSPQFLGTMDLRGDLEEAGVSVDMGNNSVDSLPEPPTGDTSFFCDTARKRNSLRSRRAKMQFIKPLNSLESCLIAQLYKEQAEMEEHMFDYVPPPSIPFVVTDGRRTISRAGSHCRSVLIGSGENMLHKRAFSAEKETEIVLGVPQLPKIGSLELPRKTEVKIRNRQIGEPGTVSNVVNGKHRHSQNGLFHGTLLFFMGISVGIVSSFLVNKRELDKLNELLKQTDNLVQDLQEELEIKDSLTVKELAIEDYESGDMHDGSYCNRARHAFSPERDLDESTEKYAGKALHDQKLEQHSESMSKIEAELEAELERLELNMNSSRLEGRLLDVLELDPNLAPEIVQGDLKANMFSRQADESCMDQDGSGTSTSHSANYAVSPRELSLRLHEVLQSRLQERVEELERALLDSQRKVQFLESMRMNSWRGLSNCGLGSSFILGSPISIEDQNPIDKPLVMNLSGEALDAYHEAYGVFMKINETKGDDLPSAGNENIHQDTSHSFDGNLHRDQNGKVNHYLPEHTSIHRPVTFSAQKERTLEEHIGIDSVGADADERDSGHEEMEKMLIKQIVEKTRQGSPAVLNAQKVLFSVDGNQH